MFFIRFSFVFDDQNYSDQTDICDGSEALFPLKTVNISTCFDLLSALTNYIQPHTMSCLREICSIGAN